MLPEEDAARARDDAYRTLFEHWPDAVILFDGNRRIIEANRAARERSAVKLMELLARREPPGSTLVDFFTAVDGGEGTMAETRLVDGTGAMRVLLLRGFSLTPERYAVIARDVTEERELGASLAQMRRVDSLGFATASIVHDFNNILTPIVALSTLVVNELDGASRFAGFAEEIQAASTRAVALVRQLQSFVRRDPRRPTRVNPPVALMEMRPLLERVAGETIDLVLALDDVALETIVDRDQLEQVVLNLVANARDAMPHGGRLTIGVKYGPLAPQPADGDGSSAATYVAVSVTDTGVGMAPEIRRRVFERFFTTKPQGGTGLGLATAHRFAVEHGGSITIESEEGNGTTVTVYLPCSERTKAQKNAPPELGFLRGEETILVVDDDAGVRRAATTVLERHGYRVLSAGSAAEALELASREPVIHLLVTDVVLPRTDGPASGSARAEGLAGGPALASALALSKPGVRVLFMSGHTDGVLEPYIEETRDLLQKGFLPTELACAVRSVLNRR